MMIARSLDAREIERVDWLMISDHEAKAMGHARIVEFHKFYSEYHIWLEAGSERVKIRISVYETNDGRFFFVQSHYVRVPHQSGELGTTHLAHATPHLALSNAVESITTYYDEAVADGHEPSLDWFVPNAAF